MPKLNNKGITTIEVIVCFVLIVLIASSMYSTISSFNKKRIAEDYRSQVLTYKHLLTKDIQDDFIKIGITHASYDKKVTNNGYTVKYTLNAELKDGTDRELIVERTVALSTYHLDGAPNQNDNFIIKYGPKNKSLKYPLPELGETPGYKSQTTGGKVEIKKDARGNPIKYSLTDPNRIMAKDLSINNIYINIDDGNVLSFYIGLYHPELGTRYGINITAPINFVSSGSTPSTGEGAFNDEIEQTDPVTPPVVETIEPKDFTYTGSPQTYTVPKTGKYKIELWGAQGGSNNSKDYGGPGGYTKGEINLNKGDTLYVYVGNYGLQPSNLIKPFNGGGAPDITGSWEASHTGIWSGGGATDIRIVGGEWDNFNSLKSRIMVAGGGAGGNNGDGSPGGVGGGLTSGTAKDSNSSNYVPTANQTTGYKFGIGQEAGLYTSDGGADSGPGGGGYYGGFRGLSTNCGGSGGSSFISGHSGCDAISEASTSNNISHTGQAKHYSGKVFKNTVMIDGNGCKWTNKITTDCSGMPTHDGTGKMSGNTGDGFARISYIG